MLWRTAIFNVFNGNAIGTIRDRVTINLTMRLTGARRHAPTQRETTIQLLFTKEYFVVHADYQIPHLFGHWACFDSCPTCFH